MMVGHTLTELSGTKFVSENQGGKVTCKIDLGDDFVLRFVLFLFLCI